MGLFISANLLSETIKKMMPSPSTALDIFNNWPMT
ncbi:hypothetical protein E2320_018392 [Naja naja]|nr:hypothetical protein E2320_018392 [Naja naja]